MGKEVIHSPDVISSNGCQDKASKHRATELSTALKWLISDLQLMSATLWGFLPYRNCHYAPPNSKLRRKKKGDIVKKNISAASELFHLGENIKRKSSKAVLLHSQCIAPPVTQAILVFFQLCSPALAHWPRLTRKKLLGKSVFKGFL